MRNKHSIESLASKGFIITDTNTTKTTKVSKANPSRPSVKERPGTPTPPPKGLKDAKTDIILIPSGMNNLEKEYYHLLSLRKSQGEISHFAFSPLKLRLAHTTFYEPDFLVVTSEGIIEIHEVKGHWEDDARVKIKVAAALHPFKFIAVTKPSKKTGWQFEHIKRP